MRLVVNMYAGQAIPAPFCSRQISFFLSNNLSQCEGLCRMKMFPVVILAKYHASAQSAVSEIPNSNVQLVFDRSHYRELFDMF